MTEPTNAALATPDFLGKDTRIALVSDMLQNAQHERLRYQQMRLINNDPLDKIIPHDPRQQPTPNTETYGEAIARLDAGINLVLTENADIAEDLAEEAHTRRKQAAKARADAT